MINAILTAAQFASEYTSMKPGDSKVIKNVTYKHQGVDYSTHVKLFRAIDDERYIVCGCGCPVRLLTHYDERPDTCCADCLMRERRKDDKLPKKREGKRAKPTARRNARKAA